MSEKPIDPLLNRIIDNGGILSMHRDKFDAEKRAAFAAGVEAAAKVAEPRFANAPGHEGDEWRFAAGEIADAIRAMSNDGE